MHTFGRDEIRDALRHARPVVALETAVLTHGLPRPINLDAIRDMEQAVRAAGAVPATIGILDGQLIVGLSDAQLEELAICKGSIKASSRDLASVLARGGSAGLTVAGTLDVCRNLGLRVFATGGIGGVHRGDSGDVSHDLLALARTPIAVVSAGAKAILDLPRTLEQLEALGVLVVGHRTDELPAFYTRSSGLRLDHRVDDVATLAAICRARWDGLGQGGVLVCNPIPAAAALDEATIGAAIDAAVADARAEAVSGKRLTPFLLARLARATGGAAVAANRALVRHDAAVAAELAVALAATS